MVNLIKNEFYKVLKKKSTVIILIIFLLYIVLTNVLVKYMSSYNNYDYRLDESYINTIKEEIKTMNPNSDMYLDYKTDIEYYELAKKYDKNSWQAFIIERDFYNYIYQVNVYKYGTAAQKATVEGNPEEEYKKQLDKLNRNDWKEYVNEEIKLVDEELIIAKQQYEDIKQFNENVETKEVQEARDRVNVLEQKKEFLQYRLDKSIPYGRNFINNAITIRETNVGLNYDYNRNGISYTEKVQLQTQISQNEKAKYIIDTQKDIDNQNNLRAILMDVYAGYSIFIVVFIVMIAGTIVSSEFDKGTIKMLLVKPYERWKILLAKYVVSIVMTVFIMAFTAIAQTLIGGVILGFDSLADPAVVYNFNTNTLVSENVFKYLLIETAAKLPMYILLTTLAFTVSVLFTNSAVAIVLPILGNIAGGIINTIAISYEVKQLKFFPTLNWDFTEFLYGKLPQYEFTDFKFAIFVCLIYWALMMIISFVTFKKKQIKNI